MIHLFGKCYLSLYALDSRKNALAVILTHTPLLCLALFATGILQAVHGYENNMPDPRTTARPDPLIQHIVISQERNSSTAKSKVRFQYRRLLQTSTDPRSFDEADRMNYSYTPFKTSCTTAEIEKYLSKSITGGKSSSPFALAFSKLLACGSSAIPHLVKILSAGDVHARFNSTIALGEMGAVANDVVVPALIKLTRQDSEPIVRAEAIQALSLISPPTDQVLSAITAATSDSIIVPGSNLNPRGELLPVSSFATDALEQYKRNLDPTQEFSSQPELRDARCPIRYVVWEGYSTEYRRYYRFNKKSGKCELEGTDRPPATGGSFLIMSFCSLFKCK